MRRTSIRHTSARSLLTRRRSIVVVHQDDAVAAADRLRLVNARAYARDIHHIRKPGAHWAFDAAVDAARVGGRPAGVAAGRRGAGDVDDMERAIVAAAAVVGEVEFSGVAGVHGWVGAVEVQRVFLWVGHPGVVGGAG